jgi:hypothetical protein
MNSKIISSVFVATVAIAFSMHVSAQALYVAPNGDVGVGTMDPDEAVDVIRSEGAARFMLTAYTDKGTQAAQFIQRRARGSADFPDATGNGDQLGLISFRGHTGSDFTGSRANISAKATEAWTDVANGSRLTFATTENGTSSSKTRLEITHDGKVMINGKKLNVPDYVFEEDYQLMSLDELSTFIVKNKHLPGVASADDVNSDGLDIAGSQLSVLEKVEELTLYTLQQHEALKQLKSENASLKERLKTMESQQAEMQAVMAEVLENQKSQRVLTSTAMN